MTMGARFTSTPAPRKRGWVGGGPCDGLVSGLGGAVLLGERVVVLLAARATVPPDRVRWDRPAVRLVVSVRVAATRAPARDSGDGTACPCSVWPELADAVTVG